NKGFVIDSRTVVVSSQNFSPAGIYENRDAGVILESPEIAQYFGPIFDADWAGARPLVVKARARSARKAGGGRATRPTGKKKAKKKKKTVAKKSQESGRVAAHDRGHDQSDASLEIPERSSAVLSSRPEARETGSEAPRVHHAVRWRGGGMAVRGARAAGGDVDSPVRQSAIA